MLFYLFEMDIRKEIFLFLTLFAHIGFAQDSTKIFFSQEIDTLAKQRFIDRYEHVFMTKTPTRHLVKLDYVSSMIRGSGVSLGYEYKILPSFSLEIRTYAQTARTHVGLSFYTFQEPVQIQEMWFNAKGRWYFNMNKRMKTGLNANNFSGSYLALSAEQSIIVHNRWPHYGTSTRRTGIQYGFQSRLLNYGHADFSIGIFHQLRNDYQDGGIYGNEYVRSNLELRTFKLATQASFGLGFGSWARKKSITPLCDVLVCDEEINGQWKVAFPQINISTIGQWASSEVAYERRIAKSSFSTALSLGASLYNISRADYTNSRSYPAERMWDTSVSGSAELGLRYYYFQKRQKLRGNGGFNFSGLYSGIAATYGYSYQYYTS